MDAFLERIIKSISRYDLLNNLLPGIIYVELTERFTLFKFHSEVFWSNLVLYYFFEIVISRIGSIIIEWLLRFLKIIEFVPYKDYLLAEEHDSMVRELSIINNMYRTYISLVLCVLLSVILGYCWPLIICSKDRMLYFSLAVCFSLVVLFICAYRKQTKYIFERCNKIKKENRI